MRVPLSWIQHNQQQENLDEDDDDVDDEDEEEEKTTFMEKLNSHQRDDDEYKGTRPRASYTKFYLIFLRRFQCNVCALPSFLLSLLYGME